MEQVALYVQEMRARMESMQQQLQQQAQQQQLHVQQQQLQAQLAQAAPAPVVVLQQDPAPHFDGNVTASSLTTTVWLKKMEHYFDMVECTSRIQIGDLERVLRAASALTGTAASWWLSMSAAQRPRTWEGFKQATMGIFQPLESGHVLCSRLEALAAAGKDLNKKAAGSGIVAYATRFVQISNEIPTDMMAQYTRIQKFCLGLPPNLAQWAWDEYMRDEKVSLTALVNKVMAKVSRTETSQIFATGASASSEAMDLSAASVSEYAMLLGLSVEQVRSSCNLPDRSVSLNAISHSRRRHDATREVIELVSPELRAERKKYSLCTRCGIERYVKGGHSSRTCRATIDTKTSALEGARRAGYTEEEIKVFQKARP